MAQGGPLAVQEVLAVALRHHQAGRLQDAERLYREILQSSPGQVDALHFLGVLAYQAGHNDLALELIGKAIAQNARVPAFHNNLGNVLKALGRHEEAVASYRLGLALKPDHVEALTSLGNSLYALGRLEEAAASYRRALRYRPTYAEAHGNLGNVLRAQGKLGEAVACYALGLSHRPGYAEVHNNLGIVLLEQGKLEEAVASSERALLHKPGYAEAYNNLGNALREQGKADDALAAYGRALAVKPDYAEARLGAAVAAIPICVATAGESREASAKFARSLDELTAWCDGDAGKLGKAVGTHQPFYLAYRPADVTTLLISYGDLLGDAAQAYWQPRANRQGVIRESRDRIRLVVVSGQVHRHPVWDMVLRGIFAHIDRGRFEIHVYHTNSTTDEETTWARARVDRFVQGPKALQAWLDEVARDRPDVIFYPEVGMDPASCALAALRLAPLQVAAWGHPVTTGLPTIDLYFSGELLEGPEAGRHYREKLVRLPGTGVYTESMPDEPRSWDAPERKSGVVRFALCQQPIKFDPADDVLYARIARAVGPSEFWLAEPSKLGWVTAQLHSRLAAAFRSLGLDPDAHLRVLPWMSRGRFLGFLDEMDVYLDCPAFSGYTTAWQATHRGVPIVTLEGEFLRQRLAAGLLRQIALTDGIASSRDEYVELAVRLAQQCRQSGEWEARRQAIRQAAVKADGNRACVRAFEQTLIGAVA